MLIEHADETSGVLFTNHSHTDQQQGASASQLHAAASSEEGQRSLPFDEAGRLAPFVAQAAGVPDIPRRRGRGGAASCDGPGSAAEGPFGERPP